jgi:hypothetical protein
MAYGSGKVYFPEHHEGWACKCLIPWSVLIPDGERHSGSVLRAHAGWRNAADDLGRIRTATTLRSMIEDFLHLSRVPGHDDVEHAQELPAKHVVEEVIAQEHCAQ